MPFADHLRPHRPQIGSLVTIDAAGLETGSGRVCVCADCDKQAEETRERTDIHDIRRVLNESSG